MDNTGNIVYDDICEMSSCEDCEFFYGCNPVRNKKINPYRRKMNGRSKEKMRFLATDFSDGKRYKSWNDYIANYHTENISWSEDCRKYWQLIYISGARKYAKWCTNRCLRASFRNSKHSIMQDIYSDETENANAPQFSQYRKEFDYFWCIY